MNEQKVRVVGNVKVWFAPWWAGWMFTLGYIIPNLEPNTLTEIAELNLFAKIGLLTTTWIGWPFLLGIELAGGF